jgi:hypothetical protein
LRPPERPEIAAPPEPEEPPPAPEPAPDEGTDVEVGDTGDEPAEAGDETSADEGEPPPTAAAVREPPPGTSPDAAAAFRRIPVSAADKPPVGAIGESGIHVDEIEMGSAYDRSRCQGDANRFSLEKVERVNVCMRVVHQREREEITVLWEREGGTMRRSKVVIKNAHAYRTRAFLVLRSEYAGSWTVRILSKDGVELASHAFEVVG